MSVQKTDRELVESVLERFNKIHHEIGEAWYDAQEVCNESDSCLTLAASAVSAWSWAAQADWDRQALRISAAFFQAGYVVVSKDRKLSLAE